MYIYRRGYHEHFLVWDRDGRFLGHVTRVERVWLAKVHIWDYTMVCSGVTPDDAVTQACLKIQRVLSGKL